MAENTAIEWATHTFNPWEGCQKVGPGCDHCYAEARNARFGGGVAVNWGPSAPRRRTSVANWRKPLQWERDHEAFKAQHGRRQRVFCASLADVFDNAVDPEWRRDLFELILRTPHLDWLLLTKRVGNAAQMVNEAMWGNGYHPGMNHRPPDNVWLGATVVNQEEADRDIQKLLAVPAAVRFLSIEPMLGPIDLTCRIEGRNGSAFGYWGFGVMERGVDWVICGGESGPGARPMHPDWARSLRDQCAAAGTPFLFKQWGEWADVDNGPQEDGPYDGKPGAWAHIDGGHHDGEMGVDFFHMHPMYRIGKKAAGRLLDGRTHDGFPEAS